MDSSNTIIKKTKAFIQNVLSFFIQLVKILLALVSFVLKKSKKKKQEEIQSSVDKKLVFSLSKSRIPNFTQLKYIKKYLSPKELLLIYISIFIMITSALIGGTSFYFKHLELVPKAGGKYTEGSVGVPQYINPLYSSLSDTDSDISRLIYSSLFNMSKDGQLTSDLVETQSVSDDQKVYSFKIHENVLWHDGENLTVDDIIFTFNLIKDSLYKSPLRSSFGGVTIEKEDDLRFKFILSDPYAAFGELLTFGIMPAHVWESTSPSAISLSPVNLRPIGSGPYESKQLVKDQMGNIKEYDLVVNEKYYGNKAKIDFSYKFFVSYEEMIAALNDNLIDGISYLPQEYIENIITPKTYNFYKLSLPQLTAVFFNSKNNTLLENVKIRKALSYSVNKEAILNDDLRGSVHLIDGPILPSSFAYNNETEKYNFNLEEANKLLAEEKWEKITITDEDILTLNEKKDSVPAENEEQKLELTDEELKKLEIGTGEWLVKDGKYFVIKLTTVETNENIIVVQAIKRNWEALGVKTELEILSPSQIQSEVIRGRNFEALFYGQVLGIDPDPYAFWHSSQTGESGFNIANFANKEVDQLLEDARIITDPLERKVKYNKFQEIVSQESPAIFMYSPSYTYVLDKKVKGFDVKSIVSPRDRFANIEEWYIETRKKLVW